MNDERPLIRQIAVNMAGRFFDKEDAKKRVLLAIERDSSPAVRADACDSYASLGKKHGSKPNPEVFKKLYEFTSVPLSYMLRVTRSHTFFAS